MRKQFEAVGKKISLLTRYGWGGDGDEEDKRHDVVSLSSWPGYYI